MSRARKTLLIVAIVLGSMVAGCTAIAVVAVVATDDTADAPAAPTTTPAPATPQALAEECFSALSSAAQQTRRSRTVNLRAGV